MNVAERNIVSSVLINHFSSFLFFIQFVWKENLDTGCFLCIFKSLFLCLSFLLVKSHHELVRSLKLDQVMKLTDFDYFSFLLVHCISENTALPVTKNVYFKFQSK